MSDIATPQFWNDLNHWRMHAKLPALEPRSIDLGGGVLPKVRTLMHEAKAGRYDCEVVSERYVHSPSAPSHQARLVFTLKCLSRVLTKPPKHDQAGKLVQAAVDGWDTVDALLNECQQIAA